MSPTSKLDFIRRCLFNAFIVSWMQNLLLIDLSWALILCISVDRSKIPLLSEQYFSEVKNCEVVEIV